MSRDPSGCTPALDELEAFLRQLLADCQPAAASPQRGRPPILPALALWGGLLVCVLRGFSSQLELWRLLAGDRFWDFPRFPISDQAVYHGLAPLADTALVPFATQVVAIDETTLDPVARKLPSLRGQPTEVTIPGKLAGRFDLRLQQWQTLRFDPAYRQNEKVLARAHCRPANGKPDPG